MINIILLICCICVGFLLGRVVQKQAIARSELFADAVKYAELFQMNVLGKRLEVAKFNANFLEDCTEPFKNYLSKNGGCKLSPQQKKHLENFFQNLDCTSGEVLLQHLQFYEKVFRDDWNVCKEEAAKSALFVKLGLLLGAMVGILFL